MGKKFNTVSGFNPRLIMWWIEGVQKPKSVIFPTRKLATRTRQSLYALRNAMKRENHYAAPLSERGEIVLRPIDVDLTGPDDPHSLIIRPANFDMNTLLDQAGIKEPQLGEMVIPTDTLEPTDPTDPTVDYEALMKGKPDT